MTVLGIEYVREDFPYLSDDEFDFVCSYWRENGKLPASLVALRFIENSKDRNLRMKRMYVGLGFDRQCSIEELMAEFELTKPTVRHIVHKPGLLPADLRLRQSLMKMLPGAPFVCDAHYFEAIMQKEHWPYDAASFMALLSMMMRGVEFIRLSETTSPYLVRNSSHSTMLFREVPIILMSLSKRTLRKQVSRACASLRSFSMTVKTSVRLFRFLRNTFP